MKKIAFISFLAAFSATSMAGTVFFKDGRALSKVKLISIAKGIITLERDGARKFYPVGKFKAYYSTDISLESQETPDTYVKYKVTVGNITCPSKGLNSKKKPSLFQFDYSVVKQKSKSKKLKVPYIYLYVLTTGKDEYSNRRVFRYYKPKMAKPKGKGYDVAAILEKLSEFKRPNWSSERMENNARHLLGRKVAIPLKGIKNRKILAWRLEIWGNSDIVYQKGEVCRPEYRVGKKWWMRIRKWIWELKTRIHTSCPCSTCCLFTFSRPIVSGHQWFVVSALKSLLRPFLRMWEPPLGGEREITNLFPALSLYVKWVRIVEAFW